MGRGVYRTQARDYMKRRDPVYLLNASSAHTPLGLFPETSRTGSVNTKQRRAVSLTQYQPLLRHLNKLHTKHLATEAI